MTKICKKCNCEKPIDLFAKGNKGTSLNFCKSCVAANMRAYRKTPSGAIALRKQNNSANHLRACREWCRKNKNKISMYRIRARLEIIKRYGGKCAMCGIDDPDVLAIDHIENNGNQHRRDIKAAGNSTSFYRWIVRNNYPPMFQILCMNCNWKKHILVLRNRPYSPRSKTSV